MTNEEALAFVESRTHNRRLRELIESGRQDQWPIVWRWAERLKDHPPAPDPVPSQDGPAARSATAPAIRPESSVAAGPAGPTACIIGPVCYVGGAEEWARALASATAHRVRWVGFGVTEAHAIDPQQRRRWEELAPVAAGAEAVRDLCARSRIVVAWGLGGLSRIVPRGPVVVSVSHSPAESDWARKVLRDGPGDPDHWVAVSEAARGPIPAPHDAGARVIPNGIDPARAVASLPRDGVRSYWGIGPGRKLVGMLGRMSEEKDPGALARALEYLPPEWFGVAIGDGWQSATLRADAARRGDRVRFLPPRDDVGNVLGTFDVMLGASVYESFWLAAVECWAAGTPLVATPVGVVGSHPDAARTIPARADGATIAGAILAAAGDPEGTARRVARGIELARGDYSLGAFGRRWGDFLAGLAPEKPLPSAARQALNLAGSMLKHTASGLAHADAATRSRRLATCEACEHFRPSDRRCASCGCFVGAKVAQASAECPEGRWK